MDTFEITIQRKSGDAWPVVVEHSRPGVFLPVRSEGVLHLDQTELLAQGTPRDYGALLGQALFRDEIRDAFVRARAESDDRLRVLLYVEADDLKTLRWERLCAPLDVGWDFLALDQRVPYSLYLPSLTDRRFPPIGRRDLRALVVAASPEGLEQVHLHPFDVAGAVSSVRAALGEIPCDVLAAVEGAVGPSTLDALSERITAERYTLLHVVCHGQYQRGEEETVLYLADAHNQVEPVPDQRLLERLARLRGARGLPHLAFLATCESASPEAEGALGGLAQRLVRELGMPAVVAMTEKVSLDTAQALAEAFYRYLREHGEVDRALVEACAGLAERHDITVPALFSRLGGRPLFSDALDRQLTNDDIAYGLSRAEELLPERAPMLKEELGALAATLRRTLDTEPKALSEVARVEREEALAEVNNLCEKVFDLTFNALALGQEPPTYDSRCPFPGLVAFGARFLASGQREQDDRAFFFGREELVKLLVDKLTEDNFLPILGPSGCGKSSLVLAGLIPKLQGQEPGLQTTYLTPGNDPLAQLEVSLSKVGDEPAVLVVDQFEELFTLCADEGKRQAFIDRLLALVKERQVVITMRADFWGDCAPYPTLKEVMQARQELIAPMNTAELRSAMEQQAAAVGLHFESDLANTILDDVQGEPGAMPLLQHALLEMWKRRNGRWLRGARYREMGGVQQAIARTADNVYRDLSSEDQERVRDIFVRLTRLGEETIQGEERRDTRRRVGLEDLVPAGSAPDATRRLVQRLADARLVVTSVSEVTGREEVEVAHEALIRHWPQLRGWLEEDQASYRLREGIGRAAREWQENPEDENLLVHRGGRLEDAEVLARQPKFPLTELEQAYVDACVALREREQAEEEARRLQELKRARWLAVSATIVGIFLLILAAVAWTQTRVARKEWQRAEHQARLAHARELAALALSHLDDRLDLSFLLSAEAFRRLDTYQTRGSLLETLRSSPRLDRFLSFRSDVARSVAFSADGQILASVRGYDVLLWDVVGRQPIGQPLTGHSDFAVSVAFSPDGKTVASASWDRTVILWDVASRQPIDQPLGHPDQVYSVAFSPDGKTLASGSGSSVILWDVASRQPIGQPLIGHSSRVYSVTFSPDGKTLASGSLDNTIILWDVASRQPIGQPLIGHSTYVYSVAFSPDGKTLASGSVGTIFLWDVANHQPIGQPLIGHSTYVYSVAFSPDGRTLASASWDTIILWDVDNRQPIGQPLTGYIGMQSVAFSPDGNILASGSWKAILLWDVAGRQPIGQPLIGHSSRVYSVTFSPDGKTLASGSLDNTIILWDVVSRQPIGQPLIGHSTYVYSVAFSPDGKTLASGSGGTIFLWDVASRRPMGQPLSHPGEVYNVAFSPDGKTLASTSWDTIILWDVVSRQPIGQPLIGHSSRVYSVAFSPDGRTLASASWDNTIILWDVASRQPIGQPLTGHSTYVYSVAFSPNGKTLASGSVGTIFLWDVASRRPMGQPLSHPGEVYSVAFSPDGKTLASASWETIILWDVASRQPMGQPLSHLGEVYSVAFSPDGKILASGGCREYDGGTCIQGATHLWDVDPQSWLARACRIVGRNFTNQEWDTYFPGEPYRKTCEQWPRGE